MKKSVSCFVFAALAATSFGAGWWSNEGESPFGKISMDFISPHIPFAARQAKPLKVFMTAYGQGQRECIELAERFAVEPVLLPVATANKVTPWDNSQDGEYYLYAMGMDKVAYEEARDKILARLPDCDAILIGRTAPKAFTPEVLAKLLDRVKAGAGLVWIEHYDTFDEIPGVTLADLDAQAIFPVDLVPQLAGTKCREGRLGKGRILQVAYPLPAPDWRGPSAFKGLCLECFTPLESDDPLYYDFCHAFLGKCLWRVTDHAAGAIARAETEVYSVRGYSVAKVAGEKLPPALPASARLAVVRKFDAAGNIADYEVLAAPKQASKIQWRFAKDGFKPGETVAGEIVAAEGVTGELQISLTDEEGRIVWQGTRTAKAGTDTVEIRFPHAQSHFAEVRADLVSDGRLVDQAFADVYFDVCESVRDEFYHISWTDCSSKSRVLALLLSQLHKEGLDVVHDICCHGYKGANRFFEVPRRIQRAGLCRAAYSTRLSGPKHGTAVGEANGADCELLGRAEKVANGTFKMPRPNKVTGLCGRIPQDLAVSQKGLGMFYYSLGDECSLARGGTTEGLVKGENCYCKECQRRFREFLKREYGTLEKLNAEYKSDYRDWSEVKQLPFVEAVKAKRYALWYDFRTFMEEQFAAWHKAEADLIARIDSEAPIGSEGWVHPENSFTGWHVPKMLKGCTYAQPYYNEREIHALKYMENDRMKTSCYGSYVGFLDPARTRRPVWRQLFSGLAGAEWWYTYVSQGACSFSNAGIFRPDLTAMEPFHAAAGEFALIRKTGLGRFMRTVKPERTGVAVHYSNRCLHAATLNPTRTTWEYSLQDFNALLGECSLAYEYLTPEEIFGGVPSWVKVFVLPDSQALDDREIAAIRAFVERGGLLVADVLPGIMDGHCAFREASPLADLFGAEVLVPKKTGRGAAFLSGETYMSFDGRVTGRTSGGLAAGFLRLVATAGVAPSVSVTDDSAFPTRSDIFVNSDFTAVCLMGPVQSQGSMKGVKGAEANMKSVEAVGGTGYRKLKLPQAKWAYDFGKGGACLGQADTFELDLEPVRGRVVVLSGRKLTAPRVTCANSVRRGEALAVTVDAVNGCVLMDVVNPAGRTVFTARSLDGKLAYPVAWNDGVGAFTLVVKSALGGFKVEKKFEVK